MGFLRFFTDEYFDDAAIEISRNGGHDSDEYDEVDNPSNPIWDGSEIHYNPFGVDPTFPDLNDVTQD